MNIFSQDYHDCKDANWYFNTLIASFVLRKPYFNKCARTVLCFAANFINNILTTSNVKNNGHAFSQ